MVRISSNKLKLGLAVLAILIWPQVISVSFAADESKVPAQFEEQARKPIVLKLMVVNPSKKHNQTFPIKAFLPEEVKPEYIIDKGSLEIEYDSTKSAFYVHEEVELEPGESIIKAITLRDVWFVSNAALNEFTEEARDLMEKIKGTSYEERGRLLLVNIETLLLQIYESQNDKTLTPDQHISTYRDNMKKIKDIEMDLMVLRRLVVSEGGDLGLLPNQSAGGGAAALPSFFTKSIAGDSAGEGGGSGDQISPAVLWRIIFLVLGFIGVLSLLFFGVWQHQLRVYKQRKQMGSKRPQGDSGGDEPSDGLNLDDFFRPKYDSRDSKKDDAA